VAAESELNPTSYIQHHLTFLTKPVGEAGGFWSVNWDTIITTLIIAVVTFGFLWSSRARRRPAFHRNGRRSSS
jgi:F-type H+-transporting ATPase subunit a